MPFLLPNQQRQSTEGTKIYLITDAQSTIRTTDCIYNTEKIQLHYHWKLSKVITSSIVSHSSSASSIMAGAQLWQNKYNTHNAAQVNVCHLQ